MAGASFIVVAANIGKICVFLSSVTVLAVGNKWFNEFNPSMKKKKKEGSDNDNTGVHIESVRKRANA